MLTSVIAYAGLIQDRFIIHGGEPPALSTSIEIILVLVEIRLYKFGVVLFFKQGVSVVYYFRRNYHKLLASNRTLLLAHSSAGLKCGGVSWVL